MNVNVAVTRAAVSRALEGKVAVVTGSTSGIGLGIARGFAEAGASVVLNGFGKTDEIAATVAELTETYKIGVTHSATDMSDAGAIEEMVASPDIDAIWLCGPNHRRVENLEAVVKALKSGKGKLTGITIEKPLARNAAEAKRVIELIEESGLLHGYLEDQLFEPAIVRGR